MAVFKVHQTSCAFLSGRFDAVEDLLLTLNLPSAARRVYRRCTQVNKFKKKTQYKMKFFLSHSSLDKPFTELFQKYILIELFRVRDSDMINTSIASTGFDFGQSISESIISVIETSSYVFLFISENFQSSQVCQNELGATLIIEKLKRRKFFKEKSFFKIIPIMIPRRDKIPELGFMMSGRNYLLINNKEHIFKLIDEISNDINLSFDSSSVTKIVNNFCEKIDERIKKIQNYWQDEGKSGLGLFDIKPKSFQQYSYEEWSNKLSKAKNTVEISGSALGFWVSKNEVFIHTVKNLLLNGVNFRILILDKLNNGLDYISQNRQTHNDDAKSVRVQIEKSEKVFGDLVRFSKEVGEGKFEFKQLKNALILTTITRIDNDLWAIPYMMATTGVDSPILFIRGKDTELFKTYSKEFNRLWEWEEIN